MVAHLAAVLYRLLPAYAANMAAPFSKYWPGRNCPINERWFGAHKTVVGFAFGVVAAVLVSFAQAHIDWVASDASAAWFYNGVAQGLGAMGGDAAKSFFKRRLAIAPGARWMPADQLDFVVGAIAVAWPWLGLDFVAIVFVLSFTFFAHIAVNHIAFHLGIRDTKW